MATRRRKLDEVLAELKALAEAPHAPEATLRLRAALGDRSSHVAARAAVIAGDAEIGELAPELAAAFDRFMQSPVKRDPGCHAKAAIVRALQLLDHPDAELFLRGAHHVQMEPVYGGQADTATDLRSAAAVALVRVRYVDLLSELAELLADPEPPVRSAAARALAYHGQSSGAALLRLRILAGDDDPQVLSDCMGALIQIDPEPGLAFVARFLESDDAGVFETASFALGESRQPEALPILQAFAESARQRDRMASALVAIATLRTDAALDYLLTQVAEASGEVARAAIEALAIYRHDDALRARVERAAERDDLDLGPTLDEAF